MSLKTEKCVTSVAFSPDTIYVAAGSLDNSARVWNISTGFVVETFDGQDGHKDSVYSVAFLPDSTSLLTASRDKTVKMWPLTASRSNLPLEPTRERIVQTFGSHKASDQNRIQLSC
jgi:glucose repression regulatory protein TUP1